VPSLSGFVLRELRCERGGSTAAGRCATVKWYISETEADVSKQTCSAGVSAQRGRPLQGGHGRRAAHTLHHGQLAMLNARGARAGVGGVQEAGGGRRKRRGGG